MEAEPPLYPVAGAAGPQGDEDRFGVPDGPEAPVSRVGSWASGLGWAPGKGRDPGREPEHSRIGGGTPHLQPESPSGDSHPRVGLWVGDPEPSMGSTDLEKADRTLGQGDRAPKMVD